jgi:hypothetical protein
MIPGCALPVARCELVPAGRCQLLAASCSLRIRFGLAVLGE